MLRRAASLLLVAALPLLARAASAFELRDLDWTLGAWQTHFEGEADIQKVFFHPDAKTLFIFTRVFSTKQTYYWDFIRIQGSDGRYRLTRYPGGDIGENCELAESGKDFAVFRNPENRDVFEIFYRKEGAQLVSGAKRHAKKWQPVLRFDRIPVPMSGPRSVEPDPVAVAPQKYKTLLQDSAARILDFRLGPGERVPVHAHPRYVMHALTPFKIRFCSKNTDEPRGNACRDFSGAAGDTIASQALTHADENIGKNELHVLLFEFKP